MTTRTERIKRATYEHSHLEDLRAAHIDARQKWIDTAAESAKQMHAFADWLHTATLEDLIDEFAGDQTRDWHLFAEPRAIQPTAVIPAGEPDGIIVINRPITDEQAQQIRDRWAALGKTVAIKQIMNQPAVLSGPAPALHGREARGDGIPVLEAAYRGERPALEAGPGWTPSRRQRWRARWRSEWTEFRREVKELARDMWHEFKRKWGVDE